MQKHRYMNRAGLGSKASRDRLWAEDVIVCGLAIFDINTRV